MKPTFDVFRLAVACVAVTMSLAPAPSRGQESEAAWYRGQTIRLITGFGPGGGYDAYARMIAPWLSRETGATVIVENQPGAGGVTALNSLSVAPPDGLRIMLANGWSSGLAQLNGAPGVRFDLGALTHLGIVSASPSVWLVKANSTITSLADARDFGRPLTWSGMAPDDGQYVGARVSCHALRLRCDIVLGYKSTAEATLAVTRGETDSTYVGDTSGNDHARTGDVRVMATMARARSRFFPDRPTVFELGNIGPEDEWLLDFEATFEKLGRILVMPAGVPAARIAFLEAAVARTLKNPGLVAEGEKTARYIDYIDPVATREAVRGAIGGLTPAQKALVRSVISATK